MVLLIMLLLKMSQEQTLLRILLSMLERAAKHICSALKDLTASIKSVK